MKTLQTEVDSLVSLIEEVERISVREAAKKLGVPASTVSEWASFLEEEGMINIEYKFTTPFLVKKGLTAEEAKEIDEQTADERDIFERKSESMLSYLNKLDQEVDSLKEIFEDLGKHFNSRFSDTKKEFKDLEKAKEQKKKVDKEILEEKKKFVRDVDDVEKKLLKEQSNYSELYTMVYNQGNIIRQILSIQQEELNFVKSADVTFEKKLKNLKKKIDSKKKTVLKKKDDLIEEAESNIREIEKRYSKIKDSLDSEKQIMGWLLKKNKDESEQTKSLNKGVVSKLNRSSAKIDKNLSDIEEIPRKLKSLISKKDKILESLRKISYNQKMLKEKLEDLMKRSSRLRSSKSSDVIKDMKELEEELGEVTDKKSFFEKEIKKIFNLLHNKR